jgi:hypothetical protein
MPSTGGIGFAPFSIRASPRMPEATDGSGASAKEVATMARDNDHALTIRLPQDLYAQLRRRAAAEERTVAAVLRLLARQYLDGAESGTTRNCPEPWDSPK